MHDPQIYAAVLPGLGAIPQYERFPAPAAGANETVVTVTAAALKPSDRLMAAGVHYAPPQLPAVAGLDGIGRLDDGTRVAFFLPRPPYGGMAERTLVRTGMWLPVPDGIDDATGAAFLNPGMTAWKTIVWEGEVTADETVLVLGATGTSGRIAAQIGLAAGARVVAVGRHPHVLQRLAGLGAATVRADLPPAELTEALAAAGPYDAVIDYLWGAPAEALFDALARGSAGEAERIRYVLVGMAAGERASVPAMAMRRSPVRLFGSGAGGPSSLAETGAAFADLLGRVDRGEIEMDVETVRLADVSRVWSDPGRGRRIVLIP